MARRLVLGKARKISDAMPPFGHGRSTLIDAGSIPLLSDLDA